MPARSTAKLLNTPSAIWRTLKKTGGLDLKFHSDMDEDVVHALLRALGKESSLTLEAAIRDPDLSVERFVGALHHRYELAA